MVVPLMLGMSCLIIPDRKCYTKKSKFIERDREYNKNIVFKKYYKKDSNKLKFKED